MRVLPVATAADVDVAVVARGARDVLRFPTEQRRRAAGPRIVGAHDRDEHADALCAEHMGIGEIEDVGRTVEGFGIHHARAAQEITAADAFRPVTVTGEAGVEFRPGPALRQLDSLHRMIQWESR